MAKKGAKKPKISPKLNQVGLNSNFQGSSGPANDKVGDEKFDPPKPKIHIFLAKNGVKKPKISPKLNQIGLSSNCQGNFLFIDKPQPRPKPSQAKSSQAKDCFHYKLKPTNDQNW